MMIGSVKRSNAGFTLVELLITLALSALLSASVVRIVIGNKQNAVLTDSYAKIQESSRYAMDYLVRDFRMAGYLGCVNADLDSPKIENLLKTTETAEYKPALHSFADPIMAIDNYDPANPAHVNAFAAVTSTTVKPVPGTDVFKSSSALATDLLSSNVQLSTTDNFSVVGPANQISVLAKGTILMLTDCNTARIFSISNVTFPSSITANIVHAQTVNPGIDNISATFGVEYQAGSQVLVMNTMIYYIGQSAAMPGQTSLYRSSSINGGVAEELVPYVQDMQLLYSVDADGDQSPDVYKTAAQIQADGDSMVDDVYSVNIALVVSGDINVDAAVLSGLQPGGTAFPDDGKLRKRYSRLVNIRNAGLATY